MATRVERYEGETNQWTPGILNRNLNPMLERHGQVPSGRQLEVGDQLRPPTLGIWGCGLRDGPLASVAPTWGHTDCQRGYDSVYVATYNRIKIGRYMIKLNSKDSVFRAGLVGSSGGIY